MGAFEDSHLISYLGNVSEAAPRAAAFWSVSPSTLLARILFHLSDYGLGSGIIFKDTCWFSHATISISVKPESIFKLSSSASFGSLLRFVVLQAGSQIYPPE